MQQERCCEGFLRTNQTWVEFPLEEAAFAMVLHRLLDPGSKLATYRWLDTVYRPEFEALELQHLYRALDYLVLGKEEHVTTMIIPLLVALSIG